VLPNSVTRGGHGDPFAAERRIIGVQEGRPIYLFSTEPPLRNMTGDFGAMALYAGEGAGRIDSVPSAADRLTAIVAEASRMLGVAEEEGSRTGSAIDVSSPACFANEADDAYMGYAGKRELIAFLNELL
jgi:nitronate monooxygenase